MKTVKMIVIKQFFVQMWRIVSLLCTFSFATFAANAQNGITAQEWVANIKIGWNLGNTLDAWFNGEQADTCNGNPLCYETLWKNPVTTKAMFTSLKDAGFNAIRIPVTWYNAIDADFNISSDWMARVTEIVNYAVENDMYIVLNSHHDERIFKLTAAEKEQSLVAFQKIWEQIADNFKNYNEKLVFEALNEPRNPANDANWGVGSAEEYAALNEHYQVFVDVVRASSGNNDKRILVINPYCASAWDDAMNALVLPTDAVPNKLIVSFHNYAPGNFAFKEGVNTWSRHYYDTGEITYPIDNYFTKYVSQGIPVIIGEFGAVNKNNEAQRAGWADFYVKYAESNGIKCFYWDNGLVTTTEDEDLFAIFDRRNQTFYFPEIVKALTGKYSATAIDYVTTDMLKIYPNPTKGQLTISGLETFNYTSLPQTIEIYNYTGYLVETNLRVCPNNTIDISHLPAGVYFIHINGERVKVVKQ